ncbi:ACT domain-containing protein [Pseudomonas putida]|uniref:ACT domain-containing protein n=1 Tax=Pseudomonas putida TaxID=303 RepID=UPI00226EB0CE|nr:ACT domain-containing protein [Pseudomonas putida]WAC00544.1 ACT domain-containing protein [Pseudomonas putida]
MAGEKSIAALLRGMSPILNEGEYVFCTVPDFAGLSPDDVVGSFKEKEGLTLIIERSRAEALGLKFDFVAAWITLTIHSALDAIGLTAAFSTALGQAGISCNVIAAYFHDHVFVGKDDAQKAMKVLNTLANASE